MYVIMKELGPAGGRGEMRAGGGSDPGSANDYGMILYCTQSLTYVGHKRQVFFFSRCAVFPAHGKYSKIVSRRFIRKLMVTTKENTLTSGFFFFNATSGGNSIHGVKIKNDDVLIATSLRYVCAAL